MYWKHFLSLSQSWSLIHTGYNELFLKAGAELGLGEGGSEEKEEEEEGRSVRRKRRGERSRGEVAMVGPTEPAVEKRRTEVGHNARVCPWASARPSRMQAPLPPLCSYLLITNN